MRSFILALIALFIPFVYSQTQTLTDVNGNTVVVAATTDALGILTSTTIQTLPAGAATTATTETPDTPDQNAGPVGQPALTSGTPHGPTPFTYTTVIDGETQKLVATFTPTFPQTVLSTAPATGSIMDYSEWLSIYGHTSAASNSAIPHMRLSSNVLLGMASSAVVCAMGGAWVFLMA